MGDPAGIGPELCIRLLHKCENSDSTEYVPLIYGDAAILEKVSACIGVPIVAPVVSPGTATEKPAIIHCATANLE